MRQRLTAHGYRAPHVVVAQERGERCSTPRRGAAVGKSGLAQQSKGFCPIGLTTRICASDGEVSSCGLIRGRAKYRLPHVRSLLRQGVKPSDGHKAWHEFAAGCTSFCSFTEGTIQGERT